ncbi:hypothetical protein Tco_0222103 [Tanacetum coccineum]
MIASLKRCVVRDNNIKNRMEKDIYKSLTPPWEAMDGVFIPPYITQDRTHEASNADDVLCSVFGLIMNPTAVEQIALDNALVAPEARLTIGKCNSRIVFLKPQREATYQVSLDALKLSPCYPAFLITTKVLDIYMHQFWNLVNKVQGSSSYHFKLDSKRFRVDAEVFHDTLQICPRLPDQPFDIPPTTNEEIVSFIYVPGYTRNIETLPELVVDHMYQPWRTFAAVINRNDDNDDNDDDDDDKANSERTETDIEENPNLTQSNIKQEEEEEEEEESERVHTPPEFVPTNEEKVDDEEKMDEEEDDEVTKVLYKDINVSLGNKDADMADVDQGGAEQHNVSQVSGFEQVEEDAHVTVTVVHDTQMTEGPMQISSVLSDFTKTSSQTSSLYTVLVTAILEITSAFTTTIPPPPSSFNPLPQQATPTPTPTTLEATTSFPALPDFSSVFKFNDIVTNLEKDLSEMKQVDQYAQSFSSIPTIVDRYIGNQLGEAIQKAIQSHNAECKEEALAEKKEYIDLIDTSVRAIIKEEVKTQLPQILPKAVLDFATPVIEQNITESLEVVVLAKSSSQPKSTYEAAASLSEFKVTKILMDKIEERKSYLRADYKIELYDALVKSYNTDKDLFESYGDVYSLKRDQDEKDKDQDPSARSDRGTKEKSQARKMSHLEIQSPRILRNDMGYTDDQPDIEAASKSDWFKKPKKPPTPDPEWNARKTIDFRPPQTWISGIAKATKPPLTFDELISTPIDFSAYIMNHLKIDNLTQ